LNSGSFQLVGEIIELSVAPAFLLVAVGSFINVTTLRLGRVVDRARQLEDLIKHEADGEEREAHMIELGSLSRRMTSSNIAIMLATFAALLVCLVVALLFVGTLTGYNAASLLAILFILTMVMLVSALLFFLNEIFIAIRSLRVRAEYTRRR